MKDSNKGHFFEVNVQYPENLRDHHRDLSICKKEKKLKQLENLQPTCMIKWNMFYK